MPAVVAVRAHVAPWRCRHRSADATRVIDEALAENHVRVVDVDFVSGLTYEADGEHFSSLQSLRIVAKRLREAVLGQDQKKKVVLLLSDSTIDHANWTADGAWTGAGSDAVRAVMEETTSAEVLVDAVCGSGYAARAHEGLHFRARLSAALHARADIDLVVFLGGWNDAHVHAAHLRAIVQSTVHLGVRGGRRRQD